MSARVGFAFAVLGLFTASLHAADGKRYAVLVGVSEYDSPALAHLPSAAADISDLTAAATAAGFETTAFTEAAGRKDKALLPTKANIEAVVKAVVAKAKKDDVVLVAFAGRGISPEGKPGRYLGTRDAKSEQLETFLSLQDLAKVLDRAPGGKVLLVEAVGIGKVEAFGGNGSKLISFPPEPRLVEGKGPERGVFFSRVTEGLKGKAADGNDTITLASLAEFVLDPKANEAKPGQEEANAIAALHPGSKEWPLVVLGRHPLAIPEAEWKEYMGVWSNGSTEPFLKKHSPARYAAWRKAAEAGSPRAMMLVADCSEFGVAGGKPDAKEAAKWYAAGAERGNTFAMIGYGLCYRKGFGVRADPREAVRWFRKSAELGDPSGMQLLGSCYLEGAGVARDPKEGVAWLRKSADLGFNQALVDLALCHLRGVGVKQDHKEALKLFMAGADRGSTRCMIFVGVCHREGYGTDEDERKAATWFKKAAEAGDLDGMNLIAKCYQDGDGVAADEKAAAGWYRKSAEAGNLTGIIQLGKCYKEGKGVTKSRAEAVRWLKQAADRGSVEAKELLRTLVD